MTLINSYPKFLKNLRIALISGIVFFIFLYAAISYISKSFGLWYLFIFLIVCYSIFMIQYELKNGVKFTNKTIRLVSGGICPLCTTNVVSDIRLRVGYAPNLYSFPNKYIRMIVDKFVGELADSVPICENCKKEFLEYRISDPSKTLLRHKFGMHRGLKNPYSQENIFYSSPTTSKSS